MTRIDAPWLHDPAARAVMHALTEAGGADCARFVGGCVRDALLGREGGDVDLATTLRPPEVVAALKAAGLKAVPTGIDHGTVTAVSAGRPFEVTTLRRDVQTDGRHAVVAFTDDWAEDAARRDFHLNALYADAAGQVFDPTGRGVADAHAGRIVFVGEARRRILEDHLRILRFFRFAAWFGREGLDAGGLAACAELADGVARLSAERVSSELMKLLAAPAPSSTVRAMQTAGVLDRVLGGEGDVARLEAVAPLTPDPVTRLSALLPDDVAFVAERARALRLSRATATRLEAAAAPLDLTGMTDGAARALVYRAGAPAVVDRAHKAWAAAPSREAEAGVVIHVAQTWTPPALPVGGRDLARLGVAPGPEVGAALRLFEEGWVEADFPGEGHSDRLAAAVSALRGSGR